MEAFDHIYRLPGLATAEQGGRKADRVKWDVVFAEELQVLHVRCLPPPASPVSLRGVGVRPFLRRGKIVNRRVEPDVEDFAFVPRPRHRYAPSKVARDAAIAQVSGQPTASQRCDPDWPTVAAIQPIAQLSDKLRLAQEEMPAGPDLEVAIAGNS